MRSIPCWKEFRSEVVRVERREPDREHALDDELNRTQDELFVRYKRKPFGALEWRVIGVYLICGDQHNGHGFSTLETYRVVRGLFDGDYFG